jgi:ureidoglycolate hydrolase
MNLQARPLTAELFESFGEVIDLNEAKQFPINTQDFLVVDRGGSGNNLEEIEVTETAWIVEASF